MSSFEAGDVVVHKMSRVQIHDFSRYKNYSSSPGIVLKNDREKSLILWNSYTEWVDHAYLLKISKVN